MQKKTVEVELLPCAVEIIAEAGQFIMVLDGRAVGVTGSQQMRASAEPKRTRKASGPRNSDLTQRILRRLSKKDLNARQLGDMIKLAVGSRNELVIELRRLQKENLVKRTANTTHKRFPDYTLTDVGRELLLPSTPASALVG